MPRRRTGPSGCAAAAHGPADITPASTTPPGRHAAPRMAKTRLVSPSPPPNAARRAANATATAKATATSRWRDRLTGAAAAAAVALVAAYALAAAPPPPMLQPPPPPPMPPSPTYCVAQSRRAHLATIMAALGRAGWSLQPTCNDTVDLMWSYHSPFGNRANEEYDLPSILHTINRHPPSARLPSGLPPRLTLVNHQPGSGAFTRKDNLRKLSIPGMPATFLLPKECSELIAYADKNPSVEWVRKNVAHRGVEAVHDNLAQERTLCSSSVGRNRKDVELDGEYLVQQMVRPHLIGGKKWDLGLYVAVTSTVPLRAWVYNDVLLRLCMLNYTDPVNNPDVNPLSFVIGQDYRPPWTEDALRPYYGRGHTTQNTLLAHLSRPDAPPAEKEAARTLLPRARKTIAQLLETVAPGMYVQGSRFVDEEAGQAREAFWTMYRFDFLIDDQLQIYLTEVNQSPNISPLHTPGLSNFFHRLTWHLVGLAGLRVGGINRHVDVGGAYGCETQGDAECAVLAPDVEVDIGWDVCHECPADCSTRACLLCRRCRTARMAAGVKRLIAEQRNRGGFRRLLPLAPRDREALGMAADVDAATASVEDLHLQAFVEHMCTVESEYEWCG